MTRIDVTERSIVPFGFDPDREAFPNGVASSTTFGSASTVAVVNPSGIASTELSGSPQINISVVALSIGSSTAIGTAKAVSILSPQGFDAGPTVFGTASTTAQVSPTGVASTLQLGDVSTIATVFIIPGPFDPTNDFGNAVVTKRGWIFRPPVSVYQWRMFKEYEGISLLKENGNWSEVPHPDLERTLNADLYLGGGRDHVVSTSLKAELEGLGYTVTEEIVTTEEYVS